MFAVDASSPEGRTGIHCELGASAFLGRLRRYQLLEITCIPLSWHSEALAGDMYGFRRGFYRTVVNFSRSVSPWLAQLLTSDSSMLNWREGRGRGGKGVEGHHKGDVYEIV